MKQYRHIAPSIIFFILLATLSITNNASGLPMRSLSDYKIPDDVYISPLYNASSSTYLPLPFFENSTISGTNNLFHLVSVTQNTTGIYAAAEQGYWDIKKGTYTRDPTIPPTAVFNLTNIVFFPYTTDAEWQALALQRNNLNDSQGFHKVIADPEGIFYIEQITQGDGSIVTLKAYYRTGILSSYEVKYPDGTSTLAGVYLGSELDMFVEPGPDIGTIILIVVSIVILVVAIGIIIMKRLRQSRPA